ncbi:hypothetical protein BC30048_2946 [Bacillus cereus]|uniref:hypothetical protein n=1 Tax=Bacillus cereus TaxID=1396 RepID=UPI001BA59892|nr:hypothetical protein [Bacillus cereus]MBR9685746.1 hypothetical protein [Bacillus cereus]MEB9966477.1 hypothetical protein [Bacillus cereus]BCD00044.1 hypothetical protein BC30048_2946 [Bacillus cereus]
MGTSKKNEKGAGRKKTIHERQVILDLIYDCIEEKKIVGEIKYQYIYPYCKKMYEDKIIDIKLSEDYWRKPGRQGTQLLEEINRVNSENVAIDDDDIVNIINTEDAINKLFDGKESNKKTLLDTLKLNEVKLKKYVKEYNRLNDKVDSLKQELLEQKQNTTDWKLKAEELQLQLFLLMEYSESKNFPIVDILKTGNARTEAVAKKLQHLFGENPTIGYDYEQYIERKHEEQRQHDKVVQLPDKSGKSAADDFGLL